MDEPLRLVRSATSADPSLTFEDFFEAESRPLFRRLWLMTGNRAEAEELMQDAFLRLWERWEHVRELENPGGYLYSTAMNLFRRRYRRALLAIRRTMGTLPGEDEFEAADERQSVRRALAELTPRQRAALVLTEMLGYSSEEAGRMLGVRASTVRALSTQGRAAFREIYGDDR